MVAENKKNLYFLFLTKMRYLALVELNLLFLASLSIIAGLFEKSLDDRVDVSLNVV